MSVHKLHRDNVHQALPCIHSLYEQCCTDNLAATHASLRTSKFKLGASNALHTLRELHNATTLKSAQQQSWLPRSSRMCGTPPIGTCTTKLRVHAALATTAHVRLLRLQLRIEPAKHRTNQAPATISRTYRLNESDTYQYITTGNNSRSETFRHLFYTPTTRQHRKTLTVVMHCHALLAYPLALAVHAFRVHLRSLPVSVCRQEGSILPQLTHST